MADNIPTQLNVMRDITGTHWGPGEGPSPTIGKWLTFISSKYSDMSRYCGSVIHEDYFEWCGLTVGYCMAMAGVRPAFGAKETDDFLWALAWLEWGDTVQTPQPGDVIVFEFAPGQQHVTLFESDAGGGFWTCRGGNQSREVKTSNFPRSCLKGIRRVPAAVAAGGGVSGAQPADPGRGAGAASSFAGGGTPLTAAGLAAAAQKLGANLASIWAITFTETDPPYGGFYKDKRPQILFERHIFSKLTKGRFDAGYPDISNPHPGGYGTGGSHQYDRLSLAMSLDESAALQSASWGIGQVLGKNFSEAGFPTPQAMVAQAFSSEDQQILAVVNEIIADGAADALANQRWADFARAYNGPNYADSNYDVRLGSWYEKFHSSALPDIRVRTAQIYLMYLGYDPSEIDGSWGKRTQSAMNDYQAKKGIPSTPSLDDATLAAIVADGLAVKGATLSAKAQGPGAGQAAASGQATSSGAQQASGSPTDPPDPSDPPDPPDP
jgi:N-acetylmuramidase/Putative peptidoglycan binding domain